MFHRVLQTHSLALSASQSVHKKKFPRIYTSMHSGGFELTKLTYTRLEDNLIPHWGDRLKVIYLPRPWAWPSGSTAVVPPQISSFLCEVRSSSTGWEPQKKRYTKERYTFTAALCLGTAVEIWHEAPREVRSLRKKVLKQVYTFTAALCLGTAVEILHEAPREVRSLRKKVLKHCTPLLQHCV